jgi:very-short-patch-repair endonuclease
MRRCGEVVRVRRDAYVLADQWRAASPEGRLALRTRAVLASRPGDVASHQSALALHGLPLHAVPLGTVDVVAHVTKVRLRSGLRTHVSDPTSATVSVGGCSCLPVEVAVAQVLVRHGVLAALVPLDAALHGRRVTVSDLAASFECMSLTPRLRRRGDRLLEVCDPACESVGETRTRLALLDLGLDVRSQVEVRDPAGRFVARVDLLVGNQVVVEFDGATKYGAADGREALVAEKRREDALRALGYVVVRVTWADLDRPGWLGARVRQAMTQLSARDAGVRAS